MYASRCQGVNGKGVVLTIPCSLPSPSAGYDRCVPENQNILIFRNIIVFLWKIKFNEKKSK
jgi:hypothetical protein